MEENPLKISNKDCRIKCNRILNMIAMNILKILIAKPQLKKVVRIKLMKLILNSNNGLRILRIRRPKLNESND
jgi:hypothetical protein